MSGEEARRDHGYPILNWLIVYQGRHCADDASGALSSGACENTAQPEATNGADPSQAAAGEAIAVENDLRAHLA
jgi:hypothetical protein